MNVTPSARRESSSCRRGLDFFFFALQTVPAVLVDETDLTPDVGQTPIGVVLPQQQAILRSAGEHPIRLVHSAGDQIVDHHADVRLVATQHQRLRARPGPSAALAPASRPCAAASSYPVVPLIWPAK